MTTEARPPDLETAFHGLISSIHSRLTLSAVQLDPELAQPGSFLKILKARHYNWHADGFRKIFGMRFTVKIPSLDQLNLIIYPDQQVETPIFLMFCLLTGRKVICHVNVNGMFDDADYRERWVRPLIDIQRQHGSFDCADRYPEWMTRWRTPAGIYGMFPKERAGDFLRCGSGYLDHYLNLALTVPPETDSSRLQIIRARHQEFVNDIRTQDKAQSMIAKMIGAEKARRIFYEVTT